jgi:hypothetical protein
MNRRLTLWATVAVLLTATAFTSLGRAATLVEQGRGRAVIILPYRLSPAAESAARVLRDHIRQMSGATLPITKEDQITGSPMPDRVWVLVGEGRLTNKLGLSSKGPGRKP